MKKFQLLFCFLWLSTFGVRAQWTSQIQSGPGSFLSIHFADANHGYVTGSRFQFSKTTTGGNQWVAQNNNLGPEELTSVFMTSPNDIYQVIKAVGTGNLDQLFISRDGGVNFIRNRYGVFNTVYFQNAATGYLVGASGTMVKTEDAGQRWNQLNTGTSQFIRDVYFPDGQTGFIVGENGMLRKTSNSGTTWQALNSGTSATLAAVYFTSPLNGYCVGTNGTALRTQDGGRTWAAMQVGTQVALHDVLFTSATTGFIVGSFGTILLTTDAGATWRSEASDTSESLNALATVPTGNGRVWAAGDNGTVLVRTAIGTATRPLLTSTAYEIYPNPTADYFTVRLGALSPVPQQISLLDLMGRVVLTTRNSTGSRPLVVPTTTLASGVYLVRVTSAAGEWRTKLTKR